MSHPLDGCFRKLKRGDRHLDELERQIAKWLQSDPYEFVQDVDAELSAHVLRSRVTKPFDEDWPLIVGEAMAQTREALDHLVQQLAIKYRGSASTNHAFPIYKTEDGFKPNKISGIPLRWKNEIRALQPYNCTPVGISPLFRLNALTQSSKHRDILVTAIGLRVPAPEFEFRIKITPGRDIQAGGMRVLGVNWIGQPVDGTVIHGIITEPFDAEMRLDFDGRFPLGIAFGEGQETLDGLRGILRVIRQIISEFRPAFD